MVFVLGFFYKEEVGKGSVLGIFVVVELVIFISKVGLGVLGGISKGFVEEFRVRRYKYFFELLGRDKGKLFRFKFVLLFLLVVFVGKVGGKFL